MTIGEKIRQTRILKGLSQENLAEMLKISTTAFGDIERNKTDLSISRAKEIANHLEINLLELLGLELQKNDNHIEILKLENDKLKLEVEKLAFETTYWREKAEQRALSDVYSVLATQNHQRKQIGF